MSTVYTLLQFHHLKCMWKRTFEYSKLSDKLSVYFKGPGWSPGKPRMGVYEELPKVREGEREREREKRQRQRETQRDRELVSYITGFTALLEITKHMLLERLNTMCSIQPNHLTH